MDEVDRLVEAWRRERPDLDATPLHVLSRVSRLAAHLESVRRAAFSRHGLEGWEFDVLAALRRAGEPYTLSPGQLVSETHVTSGTMTNRLVRLEQRGLLARSPSENDRRSVLVQLSEQGRERVDLALADLVAEEKRILGSLPEDAQNALAGLLKSLLAQFPSG